MHIQKLLSSTIISTALLFPGAAMAQSLQEAMAHAYGNNPDLASAFMDVRAAQQSIRAAQGGTQPIIAASVNISENWSSVSLPGASGNWSTSSSVGLSYSQTLFDNFATSAAVDAARARYDSALHAAANAEQNILLNVATAHFNILADRRIVSIRQENLGFVQSQLSAAGDRFEVGEATRLDIAQAEAALAQAQAGYQAALNTLRNSEANYQRWVGLPPNQLSTNLSVAQLLPASLESALETAYVDHPGLLATQAGIRAAQFQAEETRSQFGPELSLSANTGLSGLTTDSWTGSASVGLNLSIPIFVPSRAPAIEQANIGRIQSELQALSTRDTVTEAVRQGWGGMNSATAQIEAATAAVAASRVALRAVMDQNEVGEATTLDVLDAQSTVLSAEETLVTAQAQQSVATYALLSATGRLSAANLGLSVTNPIATPAASTQTTTAASDPWGNLR